MGTSNPAAFLDRFSAWLEEKLVPMTDKITNNRYVKVLMDSFMGISALTIGSSIYSISDGSGRLDGFVSSIISPLDLCTR